MTIPGRILSCSWLIWSLGCLQASRLHCCPAYCVGNSKGVSAKMHALYGVQTRPFRWWIPLVAAVGAALLAGLVACAIFTVWRRRRRRSKRALGPGQVRGPQWRNSFFYRRMRFPSC